MSKAIVLSDRGTFILKNLSNSCTVFMEAFLYGNRGFRSPQFVRSNVLRHYVMFIDVQSGVMRILKTQANTNDQKTHEGKMRPKYKLALSVLCSQCASVSCPCAHPSMKHAILANRHKRQHFPISMVKVAAKFIFMHF